MSVSLAEMQAARQGDQRAVALVLREIQDGIYRLALRALWHPDDAQDCTQDILVSVLRALPDFRGDSSLSTWAHTIAVREIAKFRAARADRPVPADTLPELEDPDPGLDAALLAEELELVCASGMLTYVSVPLRLAYLLIDVLEWPTPRAAEALGIESATARQRVARARRALRAGLRSSLLEDGHPEGRATPGDEERVRLAAAQLARLGRTQTPVDLATPDYVARLQAAHPELLARTSR